MSGEVRYERVGEVAHLTFDRPEARNAMTWAMYEQLREHCERLDADGDVRVAVLRGAGGRAFVAGTDISQFHEFSSGEDGIAYEERMDAIVERLEAVRVPTVAAVDGWAVGGGLGLVAACDWKIATPEARFGIPIARTVGNCLSMTSYARLVAIIGPTRTLQMILGAGFFGAEEALDGGLLTEIVPVERFDDRVDEVAQLLAGHAPLTMYATKQAVRRITRANVPDGEDLVRLCYGSEDFARGVRAFADKSEPAWQGR